MNDTMTAQNVVIAPDELIPASGVWQFITDSPPQGHLTISPGPLRAAAIAFLMAMSPMTAVADPWFIDRRRQIPTTLRSPFLPIVGRRISIIEARNIALAILSRAEEQRLQLAQEEALRGIDWEQQG